MKPPYGEGMIGKILLSFRGGARVLDDETREVLYELPDEPLEVVRGRLVPLRDRELRYRIIKERWVRRQLAQHPGLSPSQRVLGRRVKRTMVGISTPAG